ncbi:MAG TPA: hypothetical protein V6D22_25100 [Candidatus Obscuribacterales bacterium]
MDKIHSENEIPEVHEGALRHMFTEAYTAMTHDKANGKTIANATVEGAKMGSVWIPAIWGKAAAAGVYGADEVKLNSEPMKAVTDFGLGAAKGVALQTIGQAAVLQRITPVAAGIVSGVGSRFTEMVTSSETYERIGARGFDTNATAKILSEHILNPKTMVRDAAATLFAANALGKTAIEIEKHAHLSATITNGLKSLLKSNVPEIGMPIMAPATNGAVDDVNTREAQRERAARIGTIERVEQFIMGQSQQFEDAGQTNMHRQLLDSVRQFKYLNSLPLNKAG